MFVNQINGFFCLEYWNHNCAYCGRKDYNLTVDHYVPRKDNGKNNLFNLLPACLTCNRKKGKSHPKQFLLHVSDNNKQNIKRYLGLQHMPNTLKVLQEIYKQGVPNV